MELQLKDLGCRSKGLGESLRMRVKEVMYVACFYHVTTIPGCPTPVAYHYTMFPLRA